MSVKIESNVNNFCKPVFVNRNGVKYVETLVARGNQPDDIVLIKSDEYFTGSNSYEMKIYDKDCIQEKGSYHHVLSSFKKMIDGFLIDVSPKFRNKGYGELLKLVSIIELEENKFESISIESLPESIPFHFKYGFKPDLGVWGQNVLAIKQCLESIFSKTSEHSSLHKKSFAFISILNEESGVSQKNIEKMNLLVEKYISQNLKLWNENMLEGPLPMILEHKVVKNRAAFFNKLLKKHMINYKI